MKRWKWAGNHDARAFGERFAWQMALLFAAMASILVFNSILGGHQAGILVALVALPFFHGARTRAAGNERRRGETLEDERDVWIWTHADSMFRLAASCWYALLTLGLCIEAVQNALPANAYAVPGLILLGVPLANLVGYVAVAWLYRRDRR